MCASQSLVSSLLYRSGCDRAQCSTCFSPFGSSSITYTPRWVYRRLAGVSKRWCLENKRSYGLAITGFFRKLQMEVLACTSRHFDYDRCHRASPVRSANPALAATYIRSVRHSGKLRLHCQLNSRENSGTTGVPKPHTIQTCARFIPLCSNVCQY